MVHFDFNRVYVGETNQFFKSWSNVKVKRLSTNKKILHVSQGIFMLHIRALALTIQMLLTGL